MTKSDEDNISKDLTNNLWLSIDINRY